MKPNSLYFALIVLGALLTALPLDAQVDRANMKGTVTDCHRSRRSSSNRDDTFPENGFHAHGGVQQRGRVRVIGAAIGGVHTYRERDGT